MQHKFNIDQEVRVIRNLRNDGTFPGRERGELLVRRGAKGFVRDIGVFLQDQVIYTIHFLEYDFVVGCREQELIDVHDPWTPSRFESREKVAAKIPLAINGEVIVEAGDVGTIIKVDRDREEGVAYEINFPGRMLLVPETALDPVEYDPDAVAENEDMEYEVSDDE